MNVPFSRAATLLLPCVMFFTVSAYADTVLNTLTPTPTAGDQAKFVGEAFTTGSNAMTLTSATVQVETKLSGTPKLELEAANSNGTVGSTLFTFTYGSYTFQNPYASLLVFNAATDYVLAADTTYFLVLSDANKTVTWNYTATTTYTAMDGFTLPATHTSFVSNTDNAVSRTGTYYALSDGPAVFSLSADRIAATPEPSSMLLLATGVMGITGALRRRTVKA